MSEANEHRAAKPPTANSVVILVNNRDVKLPTRKATGLEIKEAAIAQGVKIQVDFKLFRVTGSAQHPVLDTDEVTVHEGEKFHCVAGDDNS